MEKAKNKKIFNLIMVAVIAVIIIGGVLIVSGIRNGDGGYATADKIYGIINVERDGVSFELETGNNLQQGDVITVNSKAGLTLKTEENTYQFNEKTIATLGTDETFEMDLLKGETFIVAGEEESKITAQNNTITSANSVFSVNVQTGSMGINVFKGEANFTSNGKTITIKEGEKLSVTGSESEITKLKASSLNDFNIEKAIDAVKKHELCFTKKQLNKIVEDRNTEVKADKDAAKDNDTVTKEDTDSKTEDKNDKKSDKDSADKNSSDKASSDENSSNKDNTDNNSDKNSSDKASSDENSSNKDNSDNNSDKNSNNNSDKNASSGDDTSDKGTTAKPEEPKLKCTIEIRCDTILDNMDDLASGKEGYVPANGTVLKTTTVEFTEGETVFDVLKRVCDSKGIQLEYSWSPIYNSEYIEGINHLYEFDCGDLSGWCYKVNGWAPNYGVSAYKLTDGDSIKFLYSCEGAGADVGA